MRRRLKRRQSASAVLSKRRNRAVFRVAVPGARRPVVVKRYDDWRDSLSERDALRGVLRSRAAVRHIVRLYRWGRRRGRGYIVMEYVRGPTVNELIARRGPLPPQKVAAVALNVLAGVHQLHRRGFVHGDLHGGNVIVTDFGKANVKIIDFQHAVRVGASGKARAKRVLDDPPAWLAPESRDAWIDLSYDIYCVGFICASMLAGRIPRTAAALRQCLRDDTPLWRVVNKALQPDPGLRFAHARAMMRALRAAELGSGGQPDEGADA